VVVFPAPFGPRKPVTEPGSTVKLRSETACTCPKDLLSPRTSTRTGSTVAVLAMEMGSPRVGRGVHPSNRTRVAPGSARALRACRGPAPAETISG
jgi:hypothetical protein